MNKMSVQCMALVVAFGLLCGSMTQAAEQPNIVFIMADDMGYGDAQCYNSKSKIPTPNINRLAAAGIKFTDAHSPCSVCVPTRYGLMTGRFPFRMSRRSGGSLIEPGRMTIASLLKANGYQTGMVGKWHLGFDGAEAATPAEGVSKKRKNKNKKKRGRKNLDYTKPLTGGPVDHGYANYFGIPASLDIPPYFYIRDNKAVQPPSNRIAASDSVDQGWSRIQGAFWRDGGVAPDFKHADVTPRFTSEAVGFLKQTQAGENPDPFFLYLAFPSPHTPWMPSPEFVGKSKAGMYGDFMHQVDASVGRVLSTLGELKITDDTLVVFTSDNGPVWYEADTKKFGHSSVGRLRGMKGDAWEGGHRMPFIASWPGHTAAGSVCDKLVCHTDMLATFAEVLGVDLPTDAGEDSFSFAGILHGNAGGRTADDAVIHQAAGNKLLSIRMGDWKLIPALGSSGFSKPRTEQTKPGGPIGQLYNLKEDLSEAKNVYTDHPVVVQRLSAALKRYRESGAGQ